MNKNVFVVGFMLFAIFFGAGNLIFPPALGLQSGSAFWPSMIGFVITGVGVPLLGIFISVYYGDGY
ncbi:MAG: branched-chain amino acid transport system II carrier protein [Alcaligenaceae bacterium]|nr:branched-chain amino acid transport system II carrier protein [Alcaligenaceae bacterium]